MVKGAPKEREALEMFFEFVGDRLLIAHNANFDAGFIRVAAERQEMPFTKHPKLIITKHFQPQRLKSRP